MIPSKYFGAGVALALVVIGIILFFIWGGSSVPENVRVIAKEHNLMSEQEQIKSAAERWGTGNETAASGCRVFVSLDKAKEWFGFPGEWKQCYEENRWIIFYDKLEAFITCKLIGGKYICCAGARIPDYHAWKQRCT